MDLLKKVELLLNAKTRVSLPHRKRRSPLDEQELEILAEIRAALHDVEAKERMLAERLKMELAEARNAANRGDRSEQQVHRRRAAEIEQKLDQESIFAIDLEEKLAALEEKLTLAREAVEKEARNVAKRDAEAEQVLTSHAADSKVTRQKLEQPAKQTETTARSSDDEPGLAARKARLSS
jgi:hypothetical protein